jgi:quercetin dioxygenase-like cupin family protein
VAGVYLAQQDEHQQLEWIDAGIMEVLLDSEITGGQLAVFRSDLPAGAASPVHVHGDEDEIFLLLGGSMSCWVGDDRYELHDGGVAFLPRKLPHAYRVGHRGAHLLTLCTPGGLEGFFRVAGHDLSTAKPAGWAITPERMGAALAVHGGRILGPPKGPDD